MSTEQKEKISIPEYGFLNDIFDSVLEANSHVKTTAILVSKRLSLINEIEAGLSATANKDKKGAASLVGEIVGAVGGVKVAASLIGDSNP